MLDFWNLDLEENRGSRRPSQPLSHESSHDYIQSYQQILKETSDRKLEPWMKSRNSVSYESNGNHAAKSIQEYLVRSRRKAERWLPQNRTFEQEKPSNNGLYQLGILYHIIIP